MDFTCSILCELPFMLNLPSGVYPVMAGGGQYDLEVLQEQFAAHVGERQFLVGDIPSLRQQLGEHFDHAFKQPLRTILRHRSSVNVVPGDLPAVTDNDVLEDIQAAIIGESPLAYANDKPGLEKEAQRRWTGLSSEVQASQRLLAAKKRFARRLPDTERFLLCANALIRLYMQRFNDFFVEEVAVHQLASQSPLTGVYVMVTSEGELVEHHGVVERFPPIMRRPWLNHSASLIDGFREDLQAGVQPDSIALLGVRARAFFQRGAYRSAIVESSAALDLALSRKIREGYRKQGKLDPDIDALLRQPSNQRFDERAKKLLKEATGKSAAEFDNTLWANVVEHRTRIRQGVSHADAEPPKSEAEPVVEEFLRLTDLVKGITV